MRNITILALFIIGVSPVFGQNDLITIGTQTYMGNTQGQKILDDLNINGICYRLVPTPNGDYLSVENLKTGARVVYLFENGRISLVEPLVEYVLFGYLPSKNMLIVGAHKPTDSYATISISSYDLTSQKITLRRSYGEICGVTISNDTVSVRLVSTGKFVQLSIN